MDSFFRLLENRVDHCGSLLCVGLDPHVSDLTAPTADAALEFSLRLITETAPYVAAFKPNVAFFEQFGAPGWTVLEHVIEAIALELEREHGFTFVSDDKLAASVHVSTVEDENRLIGIDDQADVADSAEYRSILAD